MSYLEFPDAPKLDHHHPRWVPAEGDKASLIAIIGEAPGQVEARMGRPFVGPAGTVLDQCLAAAGITRGECYITNVVKENPPGNDISSFFNGKIFRTEKFRAQSGQDYVHILNEELKECDANILIAAGKTALCALCSRTDIMSVHGYTMISTLLPGRKVIPIVHPSYAMRGNYIYRHIIANDLRKARRESSTPNLTYPVVNPILPNTFAEILFELENLRGKSPVAVDIEVFNHEVSCIGFASDWQRPVSILIHGAGWSIEQELRIWQAIDRILSDGSTTKVWQNGIFDRTFLFQRNHILAKGEHIDTMNSHSIVFPEFPKGLGFLTGMYLNRPVWKGMVHWKSNKKDD